MLRRVEPAKPGAEEPLVIDEDLAIDFPRREVIVRGEHVKLRPTEYRLLLHLVENAGWIVPHETLLSKVWGRSTGTTTSSCGSTSPICARRSSRTPPTRATS